MAVVRRCPCRHGVTWAAKRAKIEAKSNIYIKKQTKDKTTAKGQIYNKQSQNQTKDKTTRGQIYKKTKSKSNKGQNDKRTNLQKDILLQVVKLFLILKIKMFF